MALSLSSLVHRRDMKNGGHAVARAGIGDNAQEMWKTPCAITQLSRLAYDPARDEDPKKTTEMRAALINGDQTEQARSYQLPANE